MTPTRSGVATFVGALALSAGAAYVFGGGRDNRTMPPQPASSGAATALRDAPNKPKANGAAADAEEVELRLTHALDGARIDVPSLARGETLLAAHWRRMQIPWVALPPLARRVSTSIALLTSADEKQWAMPKKDGGTWAPDAKVWNMNEGSFDQRESLFAPTPATFGFRVTIPANARLIYSAALVAKTKDPVVFTVAVGQREADGSEREREVCTTTVTDPQKWTDAWCDLAAFAGRSVELRLRTTSGSTNPGLALWGNPTLLARRAAEVPYNVLFVVVDAMRPDLIASFHDDEVDAQAKSAEVPPLDTRLPKVPGLMPVLDDLAQKGVRFTRAWSGGAWTRPGTLSMLGGALSSQLGLDPTPWVVPDAQANAYYQSDPPLLPLLLRRAHVVTRAFVNNYFMVGYAAVGVDMGFERVDDHRHRTRDTAEITDSAVQFLRGAKHTRFFAFVNYNSPHEPWEPPPRFLDRVPAPCNQKNPPVPCGPNEDIPRKYMAEAAKDDEAIGTLLRTLDDTGMRERTLIVVTADHGETLSADHKGRSKLDEMQVRFHHAVSNYEETTRIPILMVLPGVLPADRAVKAPVSNLDIAPTVLELLGRPANTKMTGHSLMPLVRGAPGAEPGERAIVSEGRGTRAILYGKQRLIVREGGARTTTIDDKVITVAEELFDLGADPGERRNVAPKDPGRVADLHARLNAVLKNAVTADVATSVAGNEPAAAATSPVTAAAAATAGPGFIELRFAGAGKAHRVTGSLTAEGATLSLEPLGVAPDALHVSGSKAEIALTTDTEQAVGFRVKLDPPAATLKWELFMDERPLARERFYAGSFGLAEPSLERGLGSEKARAATRGAAAPEIDASRDLGVFVVRRGTAGEGGPNGEGAVPERATNAAAAQEMSRLLREWGYANRTAPGKPAAPKP